MSVSEKSFRDRQGKAQLLKDAVASFTPAYAPADTALTVSSFQTFITSVGTANTLVENLTVGYTNAATARVNLVKTIRATVTQAVGYVKSNKAWVSQFKAVKAAADKMRGVRPPTGTKAPVEVPPGGPVPPAEVARSKGEQGYVELAAHLGTFITALNACSPYTPTATGISLATFGSLVTQFNSANTSISNLTPPLTTAREARRRLYYVGDCLEKKFQAVKEAVKGQYNQSSPEYLTVRGIRW